jgi:hypothetical protein
MGIREESSMTNSVNHHISKISNGKRNDHRLFKPIRRKTTN